MKTQFKAVGNLLGDFKINYINTRRRRIEFIVFFTIIIILWVLQLSNSVEVQAYISQIQSFISIYMAFRFGIVGAAIAVMLNLKDIIYISAAYLNYPFYALAVGGILKLINIIWVLIVGIMSIKQEYHRRELRRLAITDDLTNIYNERFFHTVMEGELRNASKDGYSIGLILIDIDNFRMYNDLYGHDYGDTILKNTAAILKRIVNGRHEIFKFGSDEFAVLVKGMNIKELEEEAEAIYKSHENIKREYYNDNLVNKITFSVGLSEYPNISSSKEELISHADTALYQAKNMGEDKVNFYQDIILQINRNIGSDQQMVGVFKGLLSTITAKDKYTVGHCERVATYSTMIAEAMGLGLEEIQTLMYAGLLHDIGKIELPKSVLNKAGRLTDEEFELIRQHPVSSASILKPLSGINNLIDYVRHHHERYDGKGYPDQLAGENISLGARILCVVDSFDAMVSDRPYRKSMSVEEAFLELEKFSDTQFDPKIVNIFITLMKNRMSIKYNYKFEINPLKSPVLQR